MIPVALDNDVVLKCCLLGLLGALSNRPWKLKTLGAMQFVVRSRLSRQVGQSGLADLALELEAFMSHCEDLEPNADELQLAVELESIAQREGLPFDAGESQLLAILVLRPLALMVSGDKRALSALPQLLIRCERIQSGIGRAMCLEQLVRGFVQSGYHDHIRERLMARPWIDMTLAICFSLRSERVSHAETLAALDSYISSAVVAAGGFVAV